ncbi:putative protein C12orf71, partial [Galemys pyrenaicus]
TNRPAQTWRQTKAKWGLSEPLIWLRLPHLVSGGATSSQLLKCSRRASATFTISSMDTLEISSGFQKKASFRAPCLGEDPPSPTGLTRFPQGARHQFFSFLAHQLALPRDMPAHRRVAARHFHPNGQITRNEKVCRVVHVSYTPEKDAGPEGPDNESQREPWAVPAGDADTSWMDAQLREDLQTTTQTPLPEIRENRDWTDSSMAHSSCSSSESNLSLSVGHFPCEDAFSCENTLSCEDTSSEGPLVPFVPPIQGTWWTEGTGRLIGKRDQVQDSPEQFCKLSIGLAWDADVGAHHADPVAYLDQIRDTQWADKHPNRRTQLTLSKLHSLVQKLDRFLENLKDEDAAASAFPGHAPEEDSRPAGSCPPATAQTSHRENNVHQDLSKFNPLEEAMQPPQTSSRLPERDLAERSSQDPRSQRTSTTESSSLLLGRLEREDAQGRTQAGSCLNFRWVFRWLWRQVLSSLPARGHPDRAPKRPHKLVPKKRLFHRGKRIQPQESLELGQPVLLDF